MNKNKQLEIMLTTTEKNKLIAEFMGSKHPTIEDMYRLPHEDVYWGELQYDYSWDWLMPVVQKIEQDCEGVPQEMLNISLYSDINEVYKAVVEFIKNQNK
tara:strand:- start:83 stop:382 length:300 start_codon:yes stop_codon:yes gene_type:complete